MAASADDFLAYVNNVYSVAVQYGGGTSAANRHTMEWIRHFDYHGYRWNELLGAMDQNFLNYAGKAGITQIAAYYQDPMWSVNIKISHLMASMNGVYLLGTPAPLTTVNRADVAGWGGDWITFYADWRNAISTSPDGEAFCKANLASPTIASTFKLRDMIEDVDAYNVGMALRNNSALTLPDALKQNLKPTGMTGSHTRFHDFYTARFAGNTASTVATTQAMLLSYDDLLIASGRSLLINEQGGFFVHAPDAIAVSDLRKFCLGFDDVMQTLIAQEKTKATSP